MIGVIITYAFKILDAVMEETNSLPPEEASAARKRLYDGMVERSTRVKAAEEGDLAAIPPAMPPGGSSPPQ